MMKKDCSPKDIALAFDENFITQFYVLLTSIFINNKKSILRFHVIVTGVDEKEKTKIIEYVNSNDAEIHFYDISSIFKIDVLNTNTLKASALTVAAYYRLFFPFLISENIKKLLYLDVDIVVINCLDNLFNTDISPYPVGAVRDKVPDVANYPSYLEKIGVEADQYFNSGVLLIDIEKWKKERIFDKSMQFILDNKEILKYPDQDALNYALKGNWYELSNIYNFCYADLSMSFTKKEILKNNKIVVIHYTATKPWHFTNAHRLRSFYYYYLKKSPHVSKNKYADFNWSYSSFRGYIYVRILEFYLDHPTIGNIWKSIRSSKSTMLKLKK